MPLLLVLGFSAPQKQRREDHGESLGKTERIGQASACRPDHKIKAGPTA